MSWKDVPGRLRKDEAGSGGDRKGGGLAIPARYSLIIVDFSELEADLQAAGIQEWGSIKTRPRERRKLR